MELPTLDGAAFVRLADFHGRPVLINFWASECPPCLKEMPLLATLAQQYGSTQFLGVAVDERANALRFLAAHPPSYPQLIAPAQPAALLRRFGNKAGVLPFTVVLDAQHRICQSQVGEISRAWFDAAASACAIHP